MPYRRTAKKSLVVASLLGSYGALLVAVHCHPGADHWIARLRKSHAE